MKIEQGDIVQLLSDQSGTAVGGSYAVQLYRLQLGTVTAVGKNKAIVDVRNGAKVLGGAIWVPLDQLKVVDPGIVQGQAVIDLDTISEWRDNAVGAQAGIVSLGPLIKALEGVLATYGRTITDEPEVVPYDPIIAI